MLRVVLLQAGPVAELFLGRQPPPPAVFTRKHICTEFCFYRFLQQPGSCEAWGSLLIQLEAAGGGGCWRGAAQVSPCWEFRDTGLLLRGLKN